jgi:hypothetical protein
MTLTCCRSNACVHAAGPDFPLYSLGCHMTALKWNMQQSRFDLMAVTGCTSCLWRTVKLSCRGQWSCGGQLSVPQWRTVKLWRTVKFSVAWYVLQVHDIYSSIYHSKYYGIYHDIYNDIYYDIYHDIYACTCLIDQYCYIRSKVAWPMKEHWDLPLGKDTKANMC